MAWFLVLILTPRWCALSQIHDRMLLGGLKASESTFFKTTHDAVRVAVDAQSDGAGDDGVPSSAPDAAATLTDSDDVPSAAVAVPPAAVLFKGGSGA